MISKAASTPKKTAHAATAKRVESNLSSSPKRPKKGRVVAALLAIILALLAIVVTIYLWPEKKYEGLNIFQLGSSATFSDLQKNKDSVKKIELERGQAMHVRAVFDPKKLKNMSVRILDKQGLVRVDTGKLTLGPGKEFTIALGTGALELGRYKVKVTDQHGKEVITGDLTITSPDN